MERIKIKKQILIFLSLIIFIFPIVINALLFECANTIIEDNFDYSDNVTNHEWVLESCCGAGDVPIDSLGIFSGNSYGVLIASSATSTRAIQRVFNNISTGKALFTINYSNLVRDGNANGYSFFFSQKDNLAIGASWGGGNSAFIMQLQNNGENNISIFSNLGGDNCSEVLEFPITSQIDVELDFENDLYTIYNDNVAIDKCANKDFSANHLIALHIEEIHIDLDNTRRYIDDLKLCSAVNIIDECNFPSLFCDDFDYDEALNTRGWIVQLGGGVVNNTFSPINDKLSLTQNKNIFPFHETNPFDVTYRPDSGSRFTKHILSPVFSSEFNLVFSNISGNEIFYTASQKQTIVAYSIKAELDLVGNSSGNMNWFYLNETQPSQIWIQLCGNCTDSNDELFIKINSFFQQREEFPFNSSVSSDQIRVFSDGLLLGTINNFLDSRTSYLAQYEFGKFSSNNYTIDDYVVMVGTDKDTSTFIQYFTDKFVNDTTLVIDTGDGETGDMAVAIDTIWDDMGLRSIASRVIAGLFLMFILAVTMFGMSLSMGHQLTAGVLITIELFFMILLTFIKLLPIWLPFVVVLVSAGIGAAVIKAGTAA